jgi:hypothetical protein
LFEAQRRHREILEGKVQPVLAQEAFENLRAAKQMTLEFHPDVQRELKGDAMMDRAARRYMWRQGAVLLLALTVAGCLKPVPRVVIPASDPSPPVLTWETYNQQTRERGEVKQDGQTLEVKAGEHYVLTLAVEDLESGVKNVTLGGEGEYTCELGGKSEKKTVQLEPQQTSPLPDHENKVPVRAGLTYAVDFAKSGCKEAETFAGGKLSLVGKGQNFSNGTAAKKLHVDLKKQTAK